jgi:hypothetical protein
MSDIIKNKDPDVYNAPQEDEKSLVLTKDWTIEEERKAKRKYVRTNIRI